VTRPSDRGAAASRAPGTIEDIMAVDRATASKSAFWSALENGGLSLVSFASLIIYSRLLPPAQFGLFAMVLAVVELIGILSNMAFHDALVQRKDITERHFDTAFTASMGICVLLTAGCWAIGPLFSQLTHEPEAGKILGWMSLSFLAAGATSTLVARQRREFGFKALALRSFAGRLSGAAVGIAIAFMGAGVWALVAQQLLMVYLGSAVLWIASKDRPRFRFGLVEFKQLTAFGALSVSALFVNFAIKRMFVFFAGIYLGAGTAGFVNLAFRTIDTFWSISATALQQVTLPMMSRLQSDLPRLRRAYGLAVGLACTVMYAGFVGLGVTAPEVVELLFGRQWIAAAPYVTALGFLVLLQAPRLFIIPILTAMGRPHMVMMGYAVGLSWLIAAIFVTHLSSASVAVAVWVSCEFIYAPLFGGMLKRATGLTFKDQFVQIRAPLAAALVMAGAVYGLRLILPDSLPAVVRALALVPAGAVAFAGVLFVLDRALVKELVDFGLSFVRRRVAASA